MSETPDSTPNNDSRIHYIIAVHGIGKQRRNETILPVIGQFAAARHQQTKLTSLLPLGSLTSQSYEHEWIEFADIPKERPVSTESSFWLPEIAEPSEGKNFRFVDFCWSDVMHKQYEQIGEATEVWSQTLINRLNLRVAMKGDKTQWIAYLMATLRTAILYVEFVMNLDIPKLSNEIYAEFLGDVELYGNFPHTRGRAVRLFHETMANLHQAHRNEFGDEVDPCYTIIAHSLGTVMTMDAISYAFANKESRNSLSEDAQQQHIVHFPGYKSARNESTDIPEQNWVQFLTNYVTLGSPIDKYLSLWSENYKHFNQTNWLSQKRIQEKKSKIRHFNYCDEQDPVGHELDILMTTPVWQTLAEKIEDEVFARYPLLGIAHINYWEDTPLFTRILALAIDNKSPTDKDCAIKWYRRRAYIAGLLVAYLVLPSMGWFIATFSLYSLIQTPLALDHAVWLLTCFGIFFSTIYLTHKTMKLIIMWRLQLVISRNPNNIMEQLPERKNARAVVRGIIFISPFVWGTLTIFSLLAPGPVSIFLKIALLMAFIVSFDIFLIHKQTKQTWWEVSPFAKPEVSFADFLMSTHKN